MKFGDNLRKLRKSKKLSQEVLAEKMDVSRQSVSKWETGEAYPEMNHILKLCKIFHCKINDLVNDKMIDMDSLDNETKKSIVKLKKEEQKRVKSLSKALQVIAKIGKTICMIALPIIILVMICTPYFINNIEVKNNELTWKDPNNRIKITKENSKIVLKYNDIIIADENEEIVNSNYIDILNNNSKVQIIGYIETGFFTLLITLILTFYILKHLEMLFNNISKGDTPFTIENIDHISKIAWLMIAVIIIPNIGGIIFTLLLTTDIDIDFEMFNLVEILFLFSMIYIFRYGYQIQLDSNGKMYGDENE